MYMVTLSGAVLTQGIRPTVGAIMLRITVGSVETSRVVRVDGFTLIVRPLILDRDEAIRQAALLLTPEECCMIRAAQGVAAGPLETAAERYEGIVPEEACPCYLPASLRSPLDFTLCPLHEDVAAALR